VFLLSAWLTVTSVSYFGSRHLVTAAAEQIEQLERVYADLQSESELTSKTFVEKIDQLKANTARQRAAIGDLTAISDTLRRQLDSRERQLNGVTEERDRARAAVGNLRQAIADAESLLQSVTYEKSSLKERLGVAQGQLAAVGKQRDAARRVEVSLRWQQAQLESQIRELRNYRDTARLWLKDWVLGSSEALEQLFGGTGIDVEGLIARAGTSTEVGQGGPLQVAAPEVTGDAPALPSKFIEPADPMGGDIQRLAALQKLARTLPLAPPLDRFQITSEFGKRRDPFTNGWAFHPGLDFGAERGAEILATAPGRVVQAGPSGPYGLIVEIDHGLGISTRYGHLKSISVNVGDEVDFRQKIGVIGNTGRSTARHLHYEIRIDGAAYDPARFLDAGRFLVGIFNIAGNDQTAGDD
jgi:murein DD-endopeptidase MepM/ murein hydrolase activator NlpD